MHCLACDELLSDREAKRKSATTGEYLDLCDHCLSTINEDVNAVDVDSGFVHTSSGASDDDKH